MTGRIYITILQEPPAQDAMQMLMPESGSADEFVEAGRAVYIHCNGGYHETIYSNHYFEKKLKTRATTRNIETLAKLAALATEHQDK